MEGVNNLTLKHCSKRITVTFDEIPNCVDTMFTKFERARELLMKYSRRIIICFLIGLDIDKYNFETTGEQTNNHRQQVSTLILATERRTPPRRRTEGTMGN